MSSQPLLAYLPPEKSPKSRNAVTPPPKPRRAAPGSNDHTSMRTPLRRHPGGEQPKPSVSHLERPQQPPPPPWASTTAWSDEELPRSGTRHISRPDAARQAEELRGGGSGSMARGRTNTARRGRAHMRAASLTTSASEEEQPRLATRPAVRTASPHKQVTPQRARLLGHPTLPGRPAPATAHASARLVVQPRVAEVNGTGNAAGCRVPPTKRRPARPKRAPSQPGDSATAQGFGVGDIVSVDGRGGTVLWDGRPKNNFVKVRWLDDGSDSGVIAIDRIKFAGEPCAKTRSKANAQPPDLPDGKVYMGFRNDDAQKEGFGVMRLKDGSVYNGQWKQDRREGHGTLFFEGGVFEGQWANGDAHGKGKVHFKNGDTFQGCYVDNKKCGPGVYSWKDGAEEQGDYLGGFKHGWHQLKRGPDKWDLLYESGGVVLARMNDAPLDSGDPPTDRPCIVAPSITTGASAAAVAQESVIQPARTQPKSPRTSVTSSHGVVADVIVKKRPSLKVQSKSPRTSVTGQPPYTRSSLETGAPEANKLSKVLSTSHQVSVASAPGSNEAALEISPPSEAARPAPSKFSRSSASGSNLAMPEMSPPLRTSKSKTYKSPSTAEVLAAAPTSVEEALPELDALGMDTDDMW